MIRSFFIVVMLCATVSAHYPGGSGRCSSPNCAMCNHIRAHERGLEHDANGWYDPMSRRKVRAPESVRPETEPTKQDIVDYVLDLIDLQADDLFFDLGCGDGRFVIGAAERGARAVGIEVDPQQAELARANVQLSNVAERCVIRAGDARLIGYRHASVVVMYLYPELISELLPMCAGCRIVVSIEHAIPGATRYNHNGTSVYVLRR